MAHTFDPLLGSIRDQLRFALGDTDMDVPLLEDETYDASLAMYPAEDWRSAGADIAQHLISRFAQEPDSVSIPGEVSVSWKSRIQAWTNLLASWRGSSTQAGYASESIAPERDAPIDDEYVGRFDWNWRIKGYANQ
jgi:hypothetical protein